MEFLRVSGSKLKIVLSKDECEKHGLSVSDGECDTAKLRETISKIIDEAKESCNFEIENEKLLIQLYPKLDGGVELFITKLSFIKDRELRAIKEADNLNTYEKRDAVYAFESLDSLTRASRLMKGKGIAADIYLGDGGEYYASMKESVFGKMSDTDILSEFGTRIYAAKESFFLERCRLLTSRNGFEVFSKL